MIWAHYPKFALARVYETSTHCNMCIKSVIWAALNIVRALCPHSIRNNVSGLRLVAVGCRFVEICKIRQRKHILILVVSLSPRLVCDSASILRLLTGGPGYYYCSFFRSSLHDQLIDCQREDNDFAWHQHVKASTPALPRRTNCQSY